MEELRFNTAIAKLIELNNHLTGVVACRGLSREVAEPLALMLAPLVPHLAEELWARLGHDETFDLRARSRRPTLRCSSRTRSSTRSRSTARSVRGSRLPQRPTTRPCGPRRSPIPALESCLAGAEPRKVIVVRRPHGQHRRVSGVERSAGERATFHSTLGRSPHSRSRR